MFFEIGVKRGSAMGSPQAAVWKELRMSGQACLGSDQEVGGKGEGENELFEGELRKGGRSRVSSCFSCF